MNRFPNFPQMKIFSLIPLLITLILMLLSKPRTPLMPTTKQKKIDFVNGILQAVCNQSDSVNRIYSKEMGIWVPSAMPENLQISKIRIANSRGMIFIAFNDERENPVAELCSLYSYGIDELKEKLESDGIDYNGQRYIINCDFTSVRRSTLPCPPITG